MNLFIRIAFLTLSSILTNQLIGQTSPISLLGHNGREANFSGIAYATKEGVYTRLMNGSEMLVQWGQIDDSMYKAEGSILREPYLFLSAADIVNLAWGFYESPAIDDSIEAFMPTVIQCASDQYALILSENYNNYGIAVVCTTNGIDMKPIFHNPFDAPKPSSAVNLTSGVLNGKLADMGINGHAAFMLDLGHCRAFIYFRESPTVVYGYDPIDNALFENRLVQERPVDPFSPFSSRLKKDIREFKSDIRIASILRKVRIDFIRDRKVESKDFIFTKKMRDGIYAFSVFLSNRGVNPHLEARSTLFTTER